MFDYENDAFESASLLNAKNAVPETLGDCATGIVAGTKVATPTGWRPIEGVVAGDQVLTFDGGMQTVVKVQRDIIHHMVDPGPEENWPMHVPAEALGNREEMSLMPNQAVLVESDTAEIVFGDPFAMIPAASLEGFRDISRNPPAARVEVVTLQFAQDEVVFANIGALFFCPRAADLLSAPAANAAYAVMPLDQADIFVSLLEQEDEGAVSVIDAKKVLRVAA